MMRNMINLDMHSMKRFLVRTDDEKKINQCLDDYYILL